ncbi:thiol-disulfide oxidoreductase [Corynebacterium occultum]|uniref:Thiol-disulfide oxidoreductase n=1 Tax=Corynebacterium occultum TaxID=2675219 RepID=A0A6B8VMR6_9CORY|nr:TlpA disulfide reductase family protein [Corynebacterium occultum]QGU06792.1 thiol-disulfide oxidoreductase [Corynebacterium occultum]
MPTTDDDATLLQLQVSEWVNGPELNLEELRGRVLLIETFQMLCPGCVTAGIPQAQRVHQTFAADQVQVIGLHTVFEHHEVMGPEALKVFLAEFGVRFPVAVDLPVEGHVVPATMRHYRLQGTPSTLLVDRKGRVRNIHFGTMEDLALGAWLGTLLTESE